MDQEGALDSNLIMKFEKKYHGVQVEYYFGDKYTNFKKKFQK